MFCVVYDGSIPFLGDSNQGNVLVLITNKFYALLNTF